MTTQATQQPSSTFAPIDAFRVGRHIDSAGNTSEWTEADLRELAESYDPALREAPICIGHPKGNAPAFGWVGRVQTDGQVLQAVPSQAQPEFQDWVKRGLYKKVSLSIYGRNHPNNPKPGKLYVRHVGFLGAQPPAVAGLADYAFADGGEGSAELHEFGDWTTGVMARITRGLRDWLIGKFGQEEADKALPSWDVQALADEAVRETLPPPQAAGLSYSEGDPPMPGHTSGDPQAAAAADLAAREAALAAGQAKLAADTEALQAREAAATSAARTAQFSEFAEGLVREGRLLPKDKAALVHVLGALPEATVLEFGEGDGAVKAPAVEVLQGFLKTLPVVVDFSERAGPQRKPGAEVDLASAESIQRAALEFQDAEAKAGRTVSIEAAVQHVVDTHQEN